MTNSSKLQPILDKALNREVLDDKDILRLLEISEPGEFEALFQTARALRESSFGREIFLYGFIYLSTYCRNDCCFCYYRRSNTESLRYRKTLEDILAATKELAESGVHLIDLTMGEDPEYLDAGSNGLDRLALIVQRVKEASDLPVMISPGVVPEKGLQKLVEAGADWYACYQETHSRALFHKLRIHQNYEERYQAKVQAHALGLLIEEGLLCGIGEQHTDLVESFKAMQDLDADQIRVMNFIPQQGTPLQGRSGKGTDREPHLIAVMRLLFPEKLIPASLDVDGLSGLSKRLAAGANVVTSIIPPGKGLAGVAQSRLDIDDSRRTPAGVKPVLEQNGLQIASLQSYQAWIKQQHRN